MAIRYPAALRPGDVIGVTAPSSGVEQALVPRLEFCVETLRSRGFDVRLGSCLDGSGVVSAPAEARAAELTAMLLDPAVRAVVPPWGGALAVEVLPHLDFERIARADPTWVVGFSDTSTLLLPLTTLTGMATLYGQNLMDTPYRVPPPLLSWVDVASQRTGGTVRQGASAMHRRHGFDRWEDDPTFHEYTFDTAGTWRPLRPERGEIRTSGRLIGGCIETVSILAGTRYGNLQRFVDDHAPEGLLIYLEASGDVATDIARDLWRMRLAGWFDRANAVLVGRTSAPDEPGFTQEDAVRSVIGELDVPVVLDVDCGHLPPHLSLVNGSSTELLVTSAHAEITQALVP